MEDRESTKKMLAYTITERNGRSFWTKVGIAHWNRDSSLTIRLEALPISGVLQVREEHKGE